MKSLKLHACFAARIAIVLSCFVPRVGFGCTESKPSSPEIEIEIEVEFEDYNDVRDRVIYKIEIESNIVPPSQSTLCQCGLTFGTAGFAAPESFAVIDALVGISKDNGEDFEFDPFAGFAEDETVSQTLGNLDGVRTGATTFGFSANVDPFNLPPLQAEDRLVLGFLIEFDPDDMAEVNGNLIQFAAGSNQPGHPLNFFNGYQANLSLPPFQVHACDLNYDQTCDANDINTLFEFGQLAQGIDRTDATEIYDLNGDDRIDLVDLDTWLEEAADFNGFDAPYVYGDANVDGIFNSVDLIQIFRVGEYETGAKGQDWTTGDWNDDGEFNSSDLTLAFQAGGYDLGDANELAAVPEPSSQLLLIFAGLGLVSIRRRCGAKQDDA